MVQEHIPHDHERILSRVVIRNLVLILVLVFLVPFFGGRNALASLLITEILGGGNCRQVSYDGLAICGVTAICGEGQTAAAINSFSYSALTCPDLTPTVQNSAQSDGVVNGAGVSSGAKGITIPSAALIGNTWGYSNCNGTHDSDTTQFPSNCFVFIPTDPSTCYAQGWYWNYTESHCQSEPWYCDQQPLTCHPNGWWDWDMCQCDYPPSPIVIDVLGNGFGLTDNAAGVYFDLNGNGVKEKLSWRPLVRTMPGSPWIVTGTARSTLGRNSSVT